MTDLSPAAQAVLDAYHEEAIDYIEEWGSFRHKRGMAAALRAAADPLLMSEPLGDTDADAGVFAAHHAINAHLLTIADELERLDA
jgi:hypothetical protein